MSEQPPVPTSGQNQRVTSTLHAVDEVAMIRKGANRHQVLPRLQHLNLPISPGCHEKPATGARRRLLDVAKNAARMNNILENRDVAGSLKIPNGERSALIASAHEIADAGASEDVQRADLAALRLERADRLAARPVPHVDLSAAVAGNEGAVLPREVHHRLRVRGQHGAAAPRRQVPHAKSAVVRRRDGEVVFVDHHGADGARVAEEIVAARRVGHPEAELRVHAAGQHASFRSEFARRDPLAVACRFGEERADLLLLVDVAKNQAVVRRAGDAQVVEDVHAEQISV